jgi:AmmeMemoRadiSam system protein B
MGAGLFYPENKASIQEQLEFFGLKSGSGGNAQAIISPHGAWDISGAVAASAFHAAAGRVKGASPETAVRTVVLLGGIYDSGMTGLFLSESDYFETPIGDLPVDSGLCSELASCSTLFVISDIPHLGEYALEVQLPFVKHCFPGASIVPVLMGAGASHSVLISALANALKLVFESRLDSTLFVVSTNISRHDDEKTALFQAEACVKMLTETRTEEFLRALEQGEMNSCGCPVAAAFLGSRLLEGRPGKLVPGSLVKTKGEDRKTIYYGGIFFE